MKDRVLFEPASPLGLIAARAILAVQALWILLSVPKLPDLVAWPNEFWALPAWHQWRFGVFRFPGSEHLERVAYIVCCAALIAAVCGIATRVSCLVSSLLLYHFAPFETLVGGYVYITGVGGLTLPVLGLFLLAFVPQGRRHDPWSSDSRWPLVLIQLLFAFNYVNGGLAKMRWAGPLWYTPRNFADVSAVMWTFSQSPTARSVHDHSAIAGLMALGTFATEFLMPLAIVSKWARRVIVPLAFVAWIVRVKVFNLFFFGFPSLLVFVNWDWIDRRNRAIDREAELMIAAVRGDVTPIVTAGIDWNRLLRLAQVHGVLNALAASEIGMPAEPFGIMKRQVARNTARSLFQARESDRVLAALRARGVEAIPFKGTALSQQLYGRVSARASNDIDVLIRGESLPAVRDAMATLGYEVVDPTFHAADEILLRSGKDIPFINRTSGSMVEIHWKLFTKDRACGMPLTFDELEREGGCLSSTDTFLHLVHHGLSSRWELVKWVADIDAFVRNVAADWNTIRERARATGSVRAVHIALLVAHDLLATPLPFAVDDPAASQVARRFESWKISRVEDFRLQLRARERWRDKVRFIRMVLRLKPRDFAGEGGSAVARRFVRLLRESATSSTPNLPDGQRITELDG